VYQKSRKYRLFLQTQPDFSLKSLGSHKGFLRLYALNPACVCEISVISFVFRYTLGNTAQFPPCGLSTAPAAAARHLPHLARRIGT